MAEAEDDTLEADLGTVTNEEWLLAHQQLIALESLPADQTAFLYDPERDPATVSVFDLTHDGRPASG